jgi:hypothetical protein
MIKISSILLALTLISQTFAAEITQRYTLKQYTVSVTNQQNIVYTENAIFKLDSTLGTIWRMDNNIFKRIEIKDVVTQEGFNKAKPLAEVLIVQERLENIIIPEIKFRQESVTNIFKFLQEQLKKFDPEIQKGSDDFIKIDYSQVQSPKLKTVTFSARYISAFEALKIVAQILQCQCEFEDNRILIVPNTGSWENLIFFREYEVESSLQEQLKNNTLTNLLTQLGFDTPLRTEMKYLPEENIIIALFTCSNHEQFERLLHQTGIARKRPGRFKLTSFIKDNKNLLLLMDSHKGQTWLYQASMGKDEKREESFNLIPVTYSFNMAPY